MTLTSGGHAVQYTGDNLDEIVELGVHVVEHPTQDAVVVFAYDGALDPAGLLQPGQTVIADSGGVRIVGIPEARVLPLPEEDWFDPSRSKVDEVLEYLRGLDDQDEIDRVLAAERAGKARKSIVGDGTPPAELAEPPAPVDPALTAPADGAIDLQPDDPDDPGDVATDNLGQHEPDAE